jgi:hypothetical protein
VGFYIRKSIKVGPFRFNLSSSGVGISAGIRGLRVGTGPRGNYVHLGRNGIYYRATLPATARRSPKQTPRAAHAVSPAIPDGTHDPLRAIETGNVLEMHDSSSEALLEELVKKRRKLRVWPLVAIVFGACAVGSAAADWPQWTAGAITAIGIAATYWAFRHDLLGKTTVLFYAFEPEMEQAYERLHDAGAMLAKCSKMWTILAEGSVRDRKYHAGANKLIERKDSSIGTAPPPFVKTNIEVVSLTVGAKSLYFFPDRLLIFEGSDVGAVDYAHLAVQLEATQFIETGGVPHDAKVVGQTWRFVNKSGGPDKRFKDNRQLPICSYDEVTFNSPSGLHSVVQVSQQGVASWLAKAVPNMATAQTIRKVL